uniref:AlNc14C312G10503 protein n=1 Tax=Albugo laibachii Nc14 TaxID=890382 RepID=F0WW59_9STRA|nr:AlNc14C312G10503 [Albugo laibachii Nc14]|eukprot:CCA25678.1 AlNc14C312G10503 [Albugo laibachii Nc14]
MHQRGGGMKTSARYDTMTPAEKNALWDSFSEWRASSCMHQEISISNLKSNILALQAKFMDQSQYIRGDFAWQKSIAQFLRDMNYSLQENMDRLYSENESYCSTFCIRIAKFFQEKNRQHQCDLSRERLILAEKLGRVRQTFEIEKENQALLEKCLRQQEDLQLKSRYDMSVAQLEAEHIEREKFLSQTVIDLKSAYNSTQMRAEELSFAYQQNMVEIQQLKEKVSELVKSHPSKVVTTATKEEMTTQSLIDARESVAILKLKVLELQAEKSSITERYGQSTRDFKKTSEDLVLLRSHTSKLEREVSGKNKLIGELEENQFASKEQRTESGIQIERLKLALDEKSRQCDCLLEKQARMEKTVIIELEKANDIGTRGDQSVVLVDTESKMNLRKAVRSFYDWRKDSGKADSESPEEALNPLQLECSQTLQIRLELEQKFGAQLQARVVQERNFVLAYLRAQSCNKQKLAAFILKLSSTWKKQSKAGVSTPCPSIRDGLMFADEESTLDLYTFIGHLVSEAYQKIGYTDWNDTDLTFMQEERARLQDRVGEYEAQFQDQNKQIEQHLHHAAKSLLLHQEKEFLLAELNTRHRELRRSYDQAIAREKSFRAMSKSNDYSSAQNAIKDLSLIRFDEPPSQPSSQPTMIPTGLRAGGLKSQSPRSDTSSMLASGSVSPIPIRPVGRNPIEKRREHVRGILKEELMSTAAPSLGENHAFVGSDGVRLYINMVLYILTCVLDSSFRYSNGVFRGKLRESQRPRSTFSSQQLNQNQIYLSIR